MGCGNITVGSAADCENLPSGGTRARLILVNIDDLQTDPSAFVENGTYKITDVNLLPGRSGYTFTGFRNDMKKSDEVVNPGIGLNQFNHQISWVIYERTQAQKNNIEKLARGRFVAFAENKGRDDDAIECLGKDVGLEIVVGAIRNSHENGGFFMINLKTPEGEFESKLPQTVGTSYDNGQDILDNIVAGS
jgi:hypothetical protein